MREGDTDWGWGIVVCVTRRGAPPGGGNGGSANGHAAGGPAGATEQYMLDTLLPCAPGSVASAQNMTYNSIRSLQVCWHCHWS